MTHAEHLIENAISNMEDGKDFEYFASQKHNKTMSELSGVDLRCVWEMAQHVVYSIKPGWLFDRETEMENRYGYRLDQRDYLY
mgnify:FL=1